MKLIAGIDPGTTVGWAVLNLYGKVVAVGSKKGLDLNSIVALFTNLGKVILVGTDKAKTPSFVEEAATKLGAKVISPIQDARVEEKRDITSNLAFQNAHEMDALASALSAFKKIQPLVNKIRMFLEREKKLSLLEDVAELVLKEEISIRAAFLLLIPKPEIKEEEKTEEQKRDADIVSLYSALSHSRKDNALLLKKNRELEKRLAILEQKLSSLQERAAVLVKPKTPAEITALKQRQIASLSQRLQNTLKAQQLLQSRIDFLENALLKQDFVPLPRLTRLGWDEVMKFKDIIHEETILFVDDANEMSEKAVSWLHDKGVRLIICKKPPTQHVRSLLPFACVQAQEFEILNQIVLVKKSWLDHIRAERTVLAKIVEEYKKERLPQQ